ncbi:MAG: hypothetical protein H0V82_08395 [Candidatus Protochlamydia sp.]|nr:hypothetical protein [Candidatus Protochlamydia sp.]
MVTGMPQKDFSDIPQNYQNVDNLNIGHPTAELNRTEAFSKTSILDKISNFIENHVISTPFTRESLAWHGERLTSEGKGNIKLGHRIFNAVFLGTAALTFPVMVPMSMAALAFRNIMENKNAPQKQNNIKNQIENCKEWGIVKKETVTIKEGGLSIEKEIFSLDENKLKAAGISNKTKEFLTKYINSNDQNKANLIKNLPIRELILTNAELSRVNHMEKLGNLSEMCKDLGLIEKEDGEYTKESLENSNLSNITIKLLVSNDDHIPSVKELTKANQELSKLLDGELKNQANELVDAGILEKKGENFVFKSQDKSILKNLGFSEDSKNVIEGKTEKIPYTQQKQAIQEARVAPELKITRDLERVVIFNAEKIIKSNYLNEKADTQIKKTKNELNELKKNLESAKGQDEENIKAKITSCNILIENTESNIKGNDKQIKDCTKLLNDNIADLKKQREILDDSPNTDKLDEIKGEIDYIIKSFNDFDNLPTMERVKDLQIKNFNNTEYNQYFVQSFNNLITNLGETDNFFKSPFDDAGLAKLKLAINTLSERMNHQENKAILSEIINCYDNFSEALTDLHHIESGRSIKKMLAAEGATGEGGAAYLDRQDYTKLSTEELTLLKNKAEIINNRMIEVKEKLQSLSKKSITNDEPCYLSMKLLYKQVQITITNLTGGEIIGLGGDKIEKSVENLRNQDQVEQLKSFIEKEELRREQ